MNQKAIAALRLDKRLARRDGWIGEADLKRELDSLPDVSQKATTLDDEGGGSRTSGEGASTPGAGGATPSGGAEGSGGS